MTDKKTEALKALEEIHPGNMTPIAEEAWNKAITGIREALAEQPAQQQELASASVEPVAWMYQCSADSSGPVLMQHKRDWAESGSGLWTETPLYTSPPASKPWVGLTGEEMKAVHRNAGVTYLVPADYDRHLFTHMTDVLLMKISSAIEAKLREKNT